MVIQVSRSVDPLRKESKKLSGTSSIRLRSALVPQISSSYLLRYFLSVPPVLGAAILGMEAAGVKASPAIRKNIVESIPSVRNNSVRQP